MNEDSNRLQQNAGRTGQTALHESGLHIKC